MQCQSCKQADATVHVTDRNKGEQHLCQTCADQALRPFIINQRILAQMQAPEPSIDTAAIDAYMQERVTAGMYASLSIGIVFDQNPVFAKAYGLADRKADRPAAPETIYRIGSITKLFTTTLMCILRDKGVIRRLDDPVADYLPAGVCVPSDPRGARAITLRHLATHSSGLPVGGGPLTRSPEQLYEELSQIRLVFPTGASCGYSNIGMALLGHALALAAGTPYQALLQEHILGPLGMTSTAVDLSADQKALLATGYKGADSTEEAQDEDIGHMAPAGALASSVPDLARFLSLQMQAGRPNVRIVSGGTLRELHTPQRLTDANWQAAIGLGWFVSHKEKPGDIVCHSGRISGFRSFMGFLPRLKVGAIVLTNCGKEPDAIGHWLLETAAEACRGQPPSAGGCSS